MQRCRPIFQNLREFRYAPLAELLMKDEQCLEVYTLSIHCQLYIWLMMQHDFARYLLKLDLCLNCCLTGGDRSQDVSRKSKSAGLSARSQHRAVSRTRNGLLRRDQIPGYSSAARSRAAACAEYLRPIDITVPDGWSLICQSPSLTLSEKWGRG
jgi:hypothetical protein